MHGAKKRKGANTYVRPFETKLNIAAFFTAVSLPLQYKPR